MAKIDWPKPPKIEDADLQHWMDSLYNKLQFSGYFPNNRHQVRTVTSNYTVTQDDWLIIASGSGTTITLQENMVAGTAYVIKRVDGSNNITISRSGSDTIDGANSKTITTDYGLVAVVSDGADWHIIGQLGTIT